MASFMYRPSTLIRMSYYKLLRMNIEAWLNAGAGGGGAVVFTLLLLALGEQNSQW